MPIDMRELSGKMIRMSKHEPIQITVLTCLRCGHKWIPKRVPVRACPKCRTVRWDEPRQDAEQ